MPNRCSYDTIRRNSRSACDTSQLGTGPFFLLISPDTTWPATTLDEKGIEADPRGTEGTGAHDEVFGTESWRGTFLQNSMPILDGCDAGTSVSGRPFIGVALGLSSQLEWPLLAATPF